MASVSQDHSSYLQQDRTQNNDNDVVISGMSGLMPNSLNLREFSEKLYNKENLVKLCESRWKSNELSELDFYGNIPNLYQFDAQFFIVPYRVAKVIDPMGKKLFEQSYQVIIDAGLSPTELWGKKVGVYVSASNSESDNISKYINSDLPILGANRSMYANRLSYCLNLNGPSMSIDGANSGALMALQKAKEAIQSGQCEAAIVGSCFIMLYPQSYEYCNRLTPKDPSGKTRCYDMNANGQSKTEAVTAFFLQKYKDARRVYASICHVKNEYMKLSEEMNEKFLFYRNPVYHANFLNEFYNEAGISPSLVEYVEGLGEAIPVTDKAELQALEAVFCKDRVDPLLVGSVVSNMGYTQNSSASCAIIKVLLAYHRGKLAANLDCENPRSDIIALREGRMRIVTENQTFKRTYTAINSFSPTGISGHALLKGHYKPKDLSRYRTDLPYLVLVSGREESFVKEILDDLETRQLDPEEIVLLHNIYKKKINLHLSRGYAVYSSNNKNETIVLKQEVRHFDDLKRPLWFVYSGMGSQWIGMGTQLMRIPIFAAAIERCRKVLEPKGIDIIHILTSSDKTIYDNIMYSFIGIAAIQIGLTDVLRAVGLVPDYIIGHSVGELGCAYADGCFTAEEMILAAYSRGLVSVQTPFIHGTMAAVGIGYKQITKMCPQEIDVACHNGPTSSTISGPSDAMSKFIAELDARGIFVKEVPCSNIAYHSRYISEAGPKLLKYLKEVIKTPKPRSERWVSSSVPQEKWNEPAAKYSSAEYHTNNLLNPVLFEETLQVVPHNAVMVEIAPHGLLQAILKRSLPDNCSHIPLTRRQHSHSVTFLLEAIGKVYLKGFDVNISVLYPKIEFPVSTETPLLSHLIKYVYVDKWSVGLYDKPDRRSTSIYRPIITLHDDEYQFLSGNIIEGRIVYPIAASLVFVWDTMCMVMGKPRRELSVQFRDLHFHTQPLLRDNHPLHLSIELQRNSGRFEVIYEHGLIADGVIFAPLPLLTQSHGNEDDVMDLNSTDIYKLFYERGYDYRGEFRSIHSANLSLTQAELLWKDNWVTFIDGVIQFNILQHSHNAVSQPLYIKQINIDIQKHFKEIINDNKKHKLIYYPLQKQTRCGGLTINDILFRHKPRLVQHSTTMKVLKFVPFLQEEITAVRTTLYIFMQVVAENVNKNEITVFDITDSNDPSVLDGVKDLMNTIEIKLNVIRMNKDQIINCKNDVNKPDVILIHDLLNNKNATETLYQGLPSNIFLISSATETYRLPITVYRPIFVHGKGSAKIELVRWRPSLIAPTSAAISVCVESDFELVRAASNDLPPNHRLLIYTSYPPLPNLKSFVNQLRMGTRNNQILVAMFNRKDLMDFELDKLPNFDLVYNIFDQKVWGSEYYLPINERASECVMTLQSKHFGDLSSLHWVETERIGSGVPVTVHYAGLNVYDAKRALAQISINSADNGYGMDFSGISESGQRVMGLIRGGAASNHVLAQPEFLWPVPEHWNLEDAATVPLAYVQAFYCLSIKMSLYKNMTILVHGATGAFGQAAINIALGIGCNVFATVSDMRKKRFLRRLFPKLKEDHIGNSRDDSFGDMILSATKEKLCDVVISSVKGKLKDISLYCTSSKGYMFDMVQIHDQEKYELGLFHFDTGKNHLTIDFSTIFSSNNFKERKRLQLLLSEGIARGYVRPLSRVTYEPHAAPRALRLLAASRHRGRALLRMREQVPTVQHRISCSSDFCHLLLCIEETFALQLANKLVDRGVRKLHLHCMRPSKCLYLKTLSWQKLGVQVYISTEHLNDYESTFKLIKGSNSLGPVEAIYVVTTSKVDKESRSNLISIIENLDSASRIYSSLKYFAVIGDNNIGHEICRKRAKSGLPALSLILHDLEKFNETGECNFETDLNKIFKWSSAHEVIERALCCKETSVEASAQPLPRRDLFVELFDMTNTNINSLDDKTTLEQIGIDQGRAQEFSNILEKMFNITLPKETIPQIKIAQLRKLNKEYDEKQNESTGLSAYINVIDLDEVYANATEYIQLSTLSHTSDLRLDEFNSKLAYLCIVPGVEAHPDRFQIICERLKLPALLLRPGFDKPDETIDEAALRLSQILLKTFQNMKYFYLLGYEYGVFVVLKMAEILESNGLTGTIYCLGGAPEDIRTTLEYQLNNASLEKIQNDLAQYVYTFITGNHSMELEQRLLEAKTWHDKVDIWLSVLRKHVSYTTQYLRNIIYGIYSRIEQTRQYKPDPKCLRSKIVVIRSRQQSPIAMDLLQKYSQQPVTMYQLNTCLSDTPKDLRCAKIINNNLEAEIIDAYNKKNLCNTYLLNSFCEKR